MQDDTHVESSLHQRSGFAAADDETAAITTNKTAESLLADELNKLSFGERETISEQIHGIVEINEENPQEVKASLHGLRIELDRLCAETDNTIASALRRGRDQLQKATYLDSDEMGTMFLRSERNNCQKAAVRLCRFASLVHDLYGDTGLERWIKLSDIPEDEVAIMRQGGIQILPERDRAGRRVLVHFYENFREELSVRSRTRIMLYYALSMARDDLGSQLRGAVAVGWFHNFRVPVNEFLKIREIFHRLTRSIPIRIGACHILLPSPEPFQQPSTFVLAQVLTEVLRRELRVTRLHCGSHMECFYLLQSFGISSRGIPFDLGTGQLKLANNDRWLELCVAREERKTSSPLSSAGQSIITDPKYADILLGRGKFIMSHPGNVAFRMYVEHNVDTYAKITAKKSRTLLRDWTKSVVNNFQTRHGVRFLKENGTAWVEVSDEIARNKVRGAFRDYYARKRRVQERTNRYNNTNKQRDDILMGSKESEPQILSSEQNMDSSTSAFLEQSTSGRQNRDCCSAFSAGSVG